MNTLDALDAASLRDDIPIWLGALKPRMQRLIGRAADGWLPSLPYLQPGDLGVVIRDAAGGDVIFEVRRCAPVRRGDGGRLLDVPLERRGTVRRPAEPREVPVRLDVKRGLVRVEKQTGLGQRQCLGPVPEPAEGQRARPRADHL